MTKIKAGDRVRVEFEGVVTETYNAKELRIMPDGKPDSYAYVSPDLATKLAPALPTKIGSVIDSQHYRFLLSSHGWKSDADQSWIWSVKEFAGSMYAKDFTVVLEGK